MQHLSKWSHTEHVNQCAHIARGRGCLVLWLCASKRKADRDRHGRSPTLYPSERKRQSDMSVSVGVAPPPFTLAKEKKRERQRERERDTFWLMGGLLPPQAPSKAKQTFWLKVPSSSSPTPWSSQSQRQAGASCARAPRTPRTPPLIRQSNLTATGTLSHRLRLVHHGGERDSSS